MLTFGGRIEREMPACVLRKMTLKKKLRSLSHSATSRHTTTVAVETSVAYVRLAPV